MSIINEIKEWKIKYLYQRVIDCINQNSIEISRLTYTTGSEINLLKGLSNKLKEITAKIKIKIEIHEDETNIENLYKIINELIESLKNIKENNSVLRQQLVVVRNLLFKVKNGKIIINFEDNDISDEIKDIILTYTSKVIEKLCYNIDSKVKDSEELQTLYLYLIFQIKNDEFIINLKILIYSLLYTNKKQRYNRFIVESSLKLVNREKADHKILKKFILENNEIDNMKINDVSQNVQKFFKEKQSNRDYLYKFFTKDKIEKNFDLINKKYNKAKQEYFTNSQEEIPKFDKKEIIVDQLDKTDSSKLHLFSPEFLIVNGFKSKIEDSDIEIFNSDNYSIDIFSKFINEIINEINKSIIEDNFSTKFIDNYSIQLYKNDYLHYISAKLDNDHKKKLNETKKEEENKISDKKNILKIGVGTNQENKENESFTVLSEKGEYLSGSRLSSSKLSDRNKVNSDYFEHLLNNLFIKNIETEKLITLPNILFMLNLKIPVYDNNNNTMHFESVHLDFFDKNKKDVNNNYFYGCKEIDAIFKNNSEKVKVSYDKYFNANLTYKKNKNETKFSLENNNEFFILKDSFFFCEIKKSFPKNFGKGKEDIFNVEVYFPKSSKKKSSLNVPKPLQSYCEQLIKLIKKFSFFSKTFNNKNDNNKKLNNHIVFLYDSVNKNKEANFQDIQELTLNALDEYMDRFTGMNIKFQLVFFDLLEFIDKEYQNIDKKDNKIIELVEKDRENENKINELVEKDKEKENKINELVEKDKEKENKINELVEKDRENENKINELENKLIEKSNKLDTIKNLIEEFKNDKLDKKEILGILKTFKFD